MSEEGLWSKGGAAKEEVIVSWSGSMECRLGLVRHEAMVHGRSFAILFPRILAAKSHYRFRAF